MCKHVGKFNRPPCERRESGEGLEYYLGTLTLKVEFPMLNPVTWATIYEFDDGIASRSFPFDDP